MRPQPQPQLQPANTITVKLVNEIQAFEPNYKSPDSPKDAIYRKLWDVSFYDKSAEVQQSGMAIVCKCFCFVCLC